MLISESFLFLKQWKACKIAQKICFRHNKKNSPLLLVRSQGSLNILLYKGILVKRREEMLKICSAYWIRRNITWYFLKTLHRRRSLRLPTKICFSSNVEETITTVVLPRLSRQSVFSEMLVPPISLNGVIACKTTVWTSKYTLIIIGILDFVHRPVF
jgi:hypothetical protein